MSANEAEHDGVAAGREGGVGAGSVADGAVAGCAGKDEGPGSEVLDVDVFGVVGVCRIERGIGAERDSPAAHGHRDAADAELAGRRPVPVERDGRERDAAGGQVLDVDVGGVVGVSRVEVRRARDERDGLSVAGEGHGAGRPVGRLAGARARHAGHVAGVEFLEVGVDALLAVRGVEVAGRRQERYALAVERQRGPRRAGVALLAGGGRRRQHGRGVGQPAHVDVRRGVVVVGHEVGGHRGERHRAAVARDGEPVDAADAVAGGPGRRLGDQLGRLDDDLAGGRRRGRARCDGRAGKDRPQPNGP